MLGVLRRFIFPTDTDPIIAPEQLHPRFVDFMLDEEMWIKIKDLKHYNKTFKLTRLLTEINLSYIVKDLKEMYDQGMIFARQDDGRQETGS
jgi:predicted transcriptional regulator